MGLFGIFAHGITETWKMEKALIGLVACASEVRRASSDHRVCTIACTYLVLLVIPCCDARAQRHTSDNIVKWTERKRRWTVDDIARHDPKRQRRSCMQQADA